MTPPNLIESNASDHVELEQRADRVVMLGTRMSDLLDEELEIIGTPGTLQGRGSYGQLVIKKQQLLLDYQGAVKQLMAVMGSFASLTPTRRAQLRAVGSRLDLAAQQSAEKLSVSAAATNKVLQVIIDSVRREAQQQTTSAYHPNQFRFRDDRTPQLPPTLVAESA